jgi:hypothetical protein
LPKWHRDNRCPKNATQAMNVLSITIQQNRMQII